MTETQVDTSLVHFILLTESYFSQFCDILLSYFPEKGIIAICFVPDTEDIIFLICQGYIEIIYS